MRRARALAATISNATEALPEIEAIKQLEARYRRHESYEKRDGQWRIASSRLTGLREGLAVPGIR
jgi:hypothetical protein